MSRKNLSRTVIEGGRYYHNCWQRRASHGIERATTREWLDRVAVDVDEAEASAPPPRPKVRKLFHDKLAPAYRWLESQVGRPWSKVYSELCAKFDTRTVAGRHIVHDHMLPSVRPYDDPQPYRSRSDLVIDRHGILRKSRWFGRSYSKVRREVLAWAGGRACALTYRGWWWFHRKPIGAPCYWPQRGSCPKKHYEHEGLRCHAAELVADAPMSRAQVRYLEGLPEEHRRRLIIPSPWPAR